MKRILSRVAATSALVVGGVLSSTQAPALGMLQWFESRWETIEKKMPDAFVAGYTALWVPPPSKADSGGYSVGYDVYDRFNFGTPFDQTLYGTEAQMLQMVKTAHRANMSIYFDFVANHNGFRDLGTPGFDSSGGYPGFVLSVPNDVDGDFHGRFEGGDLNGRLAGLIDIAQEKNYVYIRQPAFAGPQNIPNQFPNPRNVKFYPDRNLPANGQGVYPFNLANPNAGDPTPENATGLTLRFAQYMVEVVGADGLRIDAVKHIPTWYFNNFFDATLYQRGRRDLNGNPTTPFNFGENFTGDKAALAAYCRKDGFGNRDALDFPLRFAFEGVLGGNGFGDMRTIENASFDSHDGNANDGSLGLPFVSSHDQDKLPNDNIGLVHILTRTGYPVVYFNAKEFGNGRDFPKDGRGDALGGDFGNFLPRVVSAARRTAKGAHFTRWIDGDVYIYERFNSLIVGLNDRADAGFDTRTVFTGFAPGTILEELTGIDEAPVNNNGDFTAFKYVTVDGGGNITIRIPRNSTGSTYHNHGFVMYGIPTPAQTQTVANTTFTLAPESTSTANGIRRLTPIPVINGTSMTVNVAIPPGTFNKCDNALIRLDDGKDIDGQSGVLITSGEFAGFEAFRTRNSPSTDGTTTSTFSQDISTTGLEEGVHFLETIAFAPRPANTPAAYSTNRSVFYLDRVPPPVSLRFPTTTGAGDVNSQSYEVVTGCPDATADAMHIFFDVPVDFNPDGLLNDSNKMRRTDRDEFRFTWNNITAGNHTITVVAFEPTGNRTIARFATVNAIVPQPNMALGVDANTSPDGVDFQGVPNTITDRAYANDIVVRVDTSGGISFPADFTVDLVVDGTTFSAVGYDPALLPAVGRLVQNDQNLSDNFDEFRFVWRGYSRGIHSIQAVAKLTSNLFPANSVSALINVPNDTQGPPLTIVSPAPGTNISTATQLAVTVDTDLTARSVIAYVSISGTENLLGKINLPAATQITLSSAIGSFLTSDQLSGLILNANGVYPIRVLASTGLDGTGITSEASTSVTVSGRPASPPQPTTPVIDGNISEFFNLTPLAVSAADGGTGTANPTDFGADGTITELHGRVANDTLYLAVRGDMFNGTDPNNNNTMILIDCDSTSGTGVKKTTSPSDITDPSADALISRVRGSNFALNSTLISAGVGFDAAVVIDGTNPLSAGTFGFGTGGVPSGTLNAVAGIQTSIAFGRGLGSLAGASGTTIAGASGFEVAIPLASLGNPNPRNMAFVVVTSSDAGFPSPNTLPENASNLFDPTQTLESVARFPAFANIKLSRIGNGAPDSVEIANTGGTDANLGSWNLRWADSNGGAVQLALTGLAVTANARKLVYDITPAPTPGGFGLAYNVPWDPSRSASAALIDPYGLGVDYVRWEGAAGATFGDLPPAGTLFTGFVPAFAGGSLGANYSVIQRDGAVTDTDRSIDWTSATVTSDTPAAQVFSPAPATLVPNGDQTPSAAEGTDYGSVPVGNSLARTFVLKNAGTQPLTLNATAAQRVRIAGANASNWSVTSQPPSATIAAGQQANFTLQFTPSASGARPATIQIDTNDPSAATYAFDVTGLGTAEPNIQIEGLSATVISSGDSTPSSTDGTDFGNVATANGSVDRTFTIRNTGNQALVLGPSSVSITGSGVEDFTLLGQPSSPVAPGGTATFTVRFDPIADGLRTATVTVNSDDADTPAYTFAISGTGAGSPNISISGATGTTDFGQSVVGTSIFTERTFIIQNTGTAALSITSTPSSAGAAAADFSVITAPTSIAAGSSAQMRVRFTASALGARNATINVPSNDPDTATVALSVSGTGVSQPGGFVSEQVDTLTTSTGWVPLGPDDASLAVLGLGSRGVDVANSALFVTLTTSTRTRVFGWSENAGRDLPYSSIGTNKYVRGKFSIYYNGPGDSLSPTTANLVPNFRLRIMERFVVNSMIEVFHNAGKFDPAVFNSAREFGPSKDPAKPSVYRVDLDPVDVPFLTGPDGSTEGTQRGFEGVADVNPLLPDYEYVQGTLNLTDCSVGTYPALDGNIAPIKTYATGGTPGSADFDNPDVSITQLRVDHDPIAFGVISGVAFGGTTGFTVTTGTAGVTFDTTGLTSAVVGLASVDFLGGNAADRNDPTQRVRMDPNRLYRISYRVSSAGNANQHGQIRLRARTVKFQWSQKLEIGGAFAVGSTAGRTIAQQSLPGVGSLNPDSDANGQWYHVIFPSPIDPAIRPDVAGGIDAKFPNLLGQPATGDPTRTSFRDLRVGFDVIDTLSFGTGYQNEVVNQTRLNRIEVRSYITPAD